MQVNNEEEIPRKIIEWLLVASAPERVDDLKAIWAKYDPKFCRVPDNVGTTLSANAKRVKFDDKTMEIYWFLGFAGWKIIDCYSPAVVCSLASGSSIRKLLEADPDLERVEADFHGALYNIRSMLLADENSQDFYPPDAPPPDGAAREKLSDTEDVATFDLTCMSTAFAFCHELRHVMYAQDKNAPPSRPDEELACDIWAREFLTAKLGEYTKAKGLDYQDVLRKRSMAAAMGVFTLYESTERSGDGGTDDYPPIVDRMDATLHNTPLAKNDHFWIVYASILLAILRRRNHSPDCTAESAMALCALLVSEIRRTL